MSRLTKKGTRMVNDFREADWYNKLANLEDIEDELGIGTVRVFNYCIECGQRLNLRSDKDEQH